MSHPIRVFTVLPTLFSSPVQMYRKGFGTKISTGGVCKMLKFSLKFFYVMGKALSGMLSCMQTGMLSHLGLAEAKLT